MTSRFKRQGAGSAQGAPARAGLSGLRELVGDQRGESLVEALVSVLIGGLALLMLAVVLASTSHLVLGTKQGMEDYYTQANAFASQVGEEHTGKVTLQCDDAEVQLVAGVAGADATQKVDYLVGDVSGEKVVSYHRSGGSSLDDLAMPDDNPEEGDGE